MKNKLKHILGTIAFFSLASLSFAQNVTGEIKGLVTDEQHNPVLGAEIKALQGGILIKNAVTFLNKKM